jgi:hypothetical protein
LGPKLRIDFQFVDGLNQAADVMTENLTKGFVDLSGRGLTAKRVTELRFDHVEGGFDVAALVVLLHEPTLVELIVVIHLTPEFALLFPLSLLVLRLLLVRPYSAELFTLNGM